MSNIHELNSLPKQATIHLITAFGAEFEHKDCNYHQLLTKLQKTILTGQFMDQEDNAAWMNHSGIDYLANPKLFEHAPLTYLCAFLSETFKNKTLKQIESNISPNVFKAIIKRLSEFE